MSLPPSPHGHILALDIGGTGLKAALLDAEGNLASDRRRVPTPHPCTSAALLDALGALVDPLRGQFERVSVGFPGVVRRGKILTAPKLGTQWLRGFPLARTLAHRFNCPVRVLNDADLQGLATVEGRGVEVVVTLGTGFGFAIFVDGQLGPRLEMSVHPARKTMTYNDYLGNDALRLVGPKKWNRRVARALESIRALTNFDRLYLGGGNAKELDLALPADVRIVENINGLRGGAWLWQSGRFNLGQLDDLEEPTVTANGEAATSATLAPKLHEESA